MAPNKELSRKTGCSVAALNATNHKHLSRVSYNDDFNVIENIIKPKTYKEKYNKKYGKMVQFTDQQRTKNILEVFAAIKEIKIFNKINFFHEKFKSYNLLFFKNIVSQSTFLQIPRAFLETIFIFLIIFIIIFGVANNQNYQDLLLTQ